jgi:uncharacterized repeat protein (TIGR01451 family)
MAIFSNQATLTYNGISTNSNIAYGEILDVVSVTKTAIEQAYTIGELVTYVISVTNTSASALTWLTLTDDLGGYTFGGGTVYPLVYEDGSATLFIDGIPQPDPAVTAGPPLTFTGVNIPAGGNAILVYQARVGSYATPSEDGEITNTVTVTGTGEPVSASETVVSGAAPLISILKSISPARVVDNDRVTYTFVIQNIGNQAVVATDNAVITDTFNPILTALAVTFDGVPWTQGVQYNYNEATGLFTTVPGQILVPAATYVQDSVTGVYNAAPGIATLVVTGTI